jgi:hypothetical protein
MSSSGQMIIQELNARHPGQIDSERPLQFCPQRAMRRTRRLRLCCGLSDCGRRLAGCLIRLQTLSNLVLTVGNQLLVASYDRPSNDCRRVNRCSAR